VKGFFVGKAELPDGDPERGVTFNQKLLSRLARKSLFQWKPFMKYISFRLFIEGKQDYLTVILKGGDIQPKAPFSPCSKKPLTFR
jgi:hypothetical protein